MNKEIVMYVRSAYCPSVALARDLLNRYNIPYREINITDDSIMAARVREWTNFLSVPTIIIANPGEDVPYTDSRICRNPCDRPGTRGKTIRRRR